MKIVKASEMARIEKLSYQEGFSEEQFMRNAGFAVALTVQQMVGQLHIEPKIFFLCGKGNNGGDGYVAARILAKGGFVVRAYALSSIEASSHLSQKMRKEFLEEKGECIEINAAEDIDFSGAELLVDALWGTGFTGELPSLYRDVIIKANQSNLPILAVDIPSGINGNDGKKGEVAIFAKKTLFLGMPKTGCFIDEAYNHVGEVAVRNFGLENRHFEQANADFILVEKELASSLLPSILRTRHKYEAGYVVGLGGSISMPGAAILACEAALRTGAGIVRLLYPEGMTGELSKAVAEVIRQPYKLGDSESILEAFARAKALFIGPGISTTSSTSALLQELLPKIDKPCVFDADALTIISEKKLSLPKGAVITPHKGEFRRLLGLENSLVTMAEYINLAKEYAAKNQLTLVLKGAPTFIFHKEAIPYVITRGDPGMATAGSGDVLTGIIAALLSQGKKEEEAAVLGCYLHGYAGELAAKKYTSYALIASDIIAHIGEAFKLLLRL